MAILLHDGLYRPPDGRSAMSLLRYYLTLGILRTSQAFFYALSFFWLDGFAVPAPAPLTQAVEEHETMEVSHFRDIQAEFMSRAQHAVYCNVATVDLRNRPRSRVMHVVWDGPTGWVITWPESHKARHLAHNPYVSLTYMNNPYKPVYIDCKADWQDAVSEKHRIWELHKSLPPPLGFDSTPHYGTIDHKYFGLLRFTPWRIELAELEKESLIWRPVPA